ncbi:MAG: hypothetical protein P8L49_00555 [Opitutaceae bacterium]|nr:hypothetical protein [Opitutaceae bacterium]
MNKFYISAEWLKPMEEAFVKGGKMHTLPFFDLGVGIGDPQDLLRRYVQSLCRYQDHVGNSGKTFCMAFDAINFFMGDGVYVAIQGGNQMRGLGDLGTGKTSLLLLLKMVNDLGIRSEEYTCEYLQTGPDMLDRLEEVSNPAKTILFWMVWTGHLRRSERCVSGVWSFWKRLVGFIVLSCPVRTAFSFEILALGKKVTAMCGNGVSTVINDFLYAYYRICKERKGEKYGRSEVKAGVAWSMLAVLRIEIGILRKKSEVISDLAWL